MHYARNQQPETPVATVQPIQFDEWGEDPPPPLDHHRGERPKVGTITLGCKVNQYESESYADAFWLRGFDIARSNERMDLCILNSCSVTHMASAKSRQALRKMRRRNPNMFLVSTGCGTEADQSAVEGVEELDLIVPNLVKDELVDRVMDALEREQRFPLPESREREEAYRVSDRTRALLKVQDGCDYFCSFCIIPYTRGTRRSRNWDDLLSEARQLARKGHREIIITGICVGTYNSKGYGLHDLLRALSEIPDIERIRLSSIEPNDVSGPIADELACNPKICRHYHIPLQSGHDEILRAMNRHYDTAQYRHTIHRLRETIPGVVFTTDLMVGFPGETEDHHRATMNFVEEMDFYKLHVFPYSARQGTKAAEWVDQVEPEVKEARSKELIAWSQANVETKNHGMIGQTVRALVEKKKRDEREFSGLTDTYLRVYFMSDRDVRGEMVSVKVTAADHDSVQGVFMG